MKSRGEKSQRREEKKKEEQGRERVRRQEMQVREKVAKSLNTVFFHVFPMICRSGGSKSRFAKRRVRSHLARWEMKSCTPLWREVHLEVKNLKAPHVRSTFGSCDVEKVHAAVARSTFGSQNVQTTPFSDHFWKLRCRKSARRGGAKRISKSKYTKRNSFGALLEAEVSQKCTRLWREAHVEVKSGKNWGVGSTFGRSDVVLHGRHKGFCTLPKVSKTWEHVQKRRQGRTRDMFMRDVRRSGLWFPERGCILEHEIFKFAKMILPDRCNTSYGLASLFRGRRNSLENMDWKNCKTHWQEAVSSALNFPLFNQVSQNCFVFDDVANFKNWGSLAELLRFWRCQVKTEEVSQNSFVFKFADRHIDG